jgi:hypothetical protein
MTWVLLAAMAAALSGGPAADDSIEVVVRGTLRTGMVAIGGETTGTTITARGLTWELDLGRDQALRRKAESLSRQRVVVRGTLEPRAGVEVPQRLIVSVNSLEAAAGRPGAE